MKFRTQCGCLISSPIPAFEDFPGTYEEVKDTFYEASKKWLRNWQRRLHRHYLKTGHLTVEFM